jgi:NAD(P) transhydrogenase subunit alpha
MIVAVPKETLAGERRVALTPAACEKLAKLSMDIRVEREAGLSAGYRDDRYAEHGARIVENRQELLAEAQIILQVRVFDAHSPELQHLRAGQILIGLADPLSDRASIESLASKNAALFAMELIPRITRAQSMDVLSSQANLTGFKAVIRSAEVLPRIFPMMMTAAGTLQPAKVFVVGAGVAGLQAIATARRLGAAVQAYDVRPAVKEQVESLGAKFVEIPQEKKSAEDKGG